MPRTVPPRAARIRLLLVLIAPWVLIHAGEAAAQPGPGTLPIEMSRPVDRTPGSPAARTARILRLLDSLPPAADEGAYWDAPLVRLWINSGIAESHADGPVWQGAGVTGAISGGGGAARGRWRAAIRPLAFVAQNAPVHTNPAGVGVERRHPTWPGSVDLPTRMGTGAHLAFDAGESFAEWRTDRLAAGVSTASELWGPADRYPLLLGAGSAGIPRLFLEGDGISIGIGRLSGRWIFGRLEASPESGLPRGERSRIASGLTMTFTPAGFDGLEVGGGRFFHLRHEPGGFSWSNATWPFSGLVKVQSRDVMDGGANQLASLFARLAPRGAGIELYGEFLREDHSWDLRDLIGQPDHSSAYMVGLRRAWRAGPDVASARIEHANGRISHLTRVRGQAPVYTHTPLVEGHTHRGQSLAAPDVLSGGGLSISFDRIGATRSDFLSTEARATAQNGEGGSWSGRHYGEYSVGAGRTWIRAARHWGLAAWVRQSYGDTSGLDLTVAFRVR